jgi:MFS family permease
VGFVARPLGAIVFGHLGDRVGRKTTLAVAMIMMGAATTLIGFLPTYKSIGIWAPVALVALRIVQGLAVGGQWGGAILLATESAPKSRRGLYGSFAQAGVPVGVIMANLAFLLANNVLAPEDFLAWGWRVPFIFSVALVALGIYVQFRVEDTAAFRQLKKSERSPVLEALRIHPRLILLAAGAYLSTNLHYYIYLAYVVAYGSSATGLGLPRGTLLTAVLVGNACMLPMLFVAGKLSDLLGRRRVIMVGVVLAGLWALLLFPLVDTRSILLIMVAYSGYHVVSSLAYGPLAAMFAELFSTHVRYSAASLAYQIAAIAGGGLAPVIATGLYAHFHNNQWIAAYMIFTSIISLLCMLALRETRHSDLA